jgi:hypothetical protein
LYGTIRIENREAILGNGVKGKVEGSDACSREGEVGELSMCA